MSTIIKTFKLGVMFSICMLANEGFAEIQIPGPDDWTDQGIAIDDGSSGAWDVRLGGAISPGAMVKKNGTYFLYYIGADGDRSTDGGPRNRAIGVATSTDGINFTKYAGNPVITHQPHGNQEEGAFSVTATLDAAGNIVVYYGALWAENSTTEQVDVYVTLATSTDGFAFDNRGDTGDYEYAPSGQEVDPIGVMLNQGTWYVYYLNNSGWQLRMLSGPAIDNLTDQGSVTGTGGSAKGGGLPIPLNATDFVTFVDHYNTRDPLVLTGSFSDPTALTQVDRYTGWGGTTHKHAFTYLDISTSTWFMYYQNRDLDAIGVKTAPMLVDGQAEKIPQPPTDVA